ncbi:MAG: YjjG family noncanonical pyrimidine nucleotidase [Draconibacterium sp.]|nr:YjjG family noncanonical pyrimidine nucleotidase [Draconibacterium sp.]
MKPKKKRYTHIFFDLDNTLWDFKQNSFYAMQSSFQLFNIETQNVEFEKFFEVYSKHNHSLWSEYRKKKVSKKELIRLRFKKSFDELDIKGIDPELMNTCYLNEMPKQYYLKEGVLELLEYLKNKRYKLNIVTNGFTEVQHKKVESSGLKPFINKIFTSEEVKTPKPGREIFEYAIKSTNARKTNSLMVGDDWEVDVLGAIGFGIDAAYFVNSKKVKLEHLKNSQKLKNVIYKIGELNQLQSIL